mmetsp:Transcript_36076/g.83815  ORF Transcript_36076/g.83815 Transcript_36076/m.83815 type:complete len:236 (+) Transcript_36076:896-1603(+)
METHLLELALPEVDPQVPDRPSLAGLDIDGPGAPVPDTDMHLRLPRHPQHLQVHLDHGLDAHGEREPLGAMADVRCAVHLVSEIVEELGDPLLLRHIVAQVEDVNRALDHGAQHGIQAHVALEGQIRTQARGVVEVRGEDAAEAAVPLPLPGQLLGELAIVAEDLPDVPLRLVGAQRRQDAERGVHEDMLDRAAYGQEGAEAEQMASVDRWRGDREHDKVAHRDAGVHGQGGDRQ